MAPGSISNQETFLTQGAQKRRAHREKTAMFDLAGEVSNSGVFLRRGDPFSPFTHNYPSLDFGRETGNRWVIELLFRRSVARSMVPDMDEKNAPDKSASSSCASCSSMQHHTVNLSGTAQHQAIQFSRDSSLSHPAILRCDAWAQHPMWFISSTSKFRRAE